MLTAPKLPAEKWLSAARQRILGDRGIKGNLLKLCPIVAIANRGYYRDSMGEPGLNDFGVYDDAIALIDTRNGVVTTYRWNSDPSRAGYNPGIDKPYAILTPGIWPFFKGLHRNKYKAWRQFDPDTAKQRHLANYFSDQRADGSFSVWRGQPGKGLEWGYQAINQHPGNAETTNSWGCQTAPPDHFQLYQQESYRLTAETNQPFLPYILTEDWLQA